jgi:hypothetical protein
MRAVLIRFPIIALAAVLIMIAIRYLTDPVGAAAQVGIAITSPGGTIVARVAFGAFPLGFAAFFAVCLFSGDRLLSALHTELTLLGIVIAVRITGMAAARSSETAKLLLPEAIMALLCIAAIRLTRKEQKLPYRDRAGSTIALAKLRGESRARLLAARVLTGLVALAFIGSAMTKLAHVPKVVAGLVHDGIPSAALVPIAILEISLAVSYLIPRTSLLGTVLLTGYLGGATVTHIIGRETFAPPVLIGVLLFASAYLRYPDLRSRLFPFLSPQSTDSTADYMKGIATKTQADPVAGSSDRITSATKV